jgi:GH24 family phage-related lysozyme (muramidase)
MPPVLVKPKRVPSPEELHGDEFGFKPDEEEPMPEYDRKTLVDSAFKVIKRHEDFKPEPYLDTKNKWTIGIGTLIGKGTDADLKASPFYKKKIDENTAKQIALGDINKKIDLTKRLLGPEVFDSFSPKLQAQLISGAYRGDITGSPKALALLKKGNFQGAAKEYLDNKEYREAKQKESGVATRMEEVALTMATEKPDNFSDAVEYNLRRSKLLP